MMTGGRADEEPSIEELYNQVARERNEKILADKAATLREKQGARKKQSDKEYEAYWKRQSGRFA
jgi:hypothetical protein